MEGALNQHTLRVYELQQACVRMDSTTVNGHWTVTEDGLFQFGHIKDHRPDLVGSKNSNVPLQERLQPSTSLLG